MWQENDNKELALKHLPDEGDTRLIAITVTTRYDGVWRSNVRILFYLTATYSKDSGAKGIQMCSVTKKS